VNLDPSKKITVRASLPGIAFSNLSGQVLTSGLFTDINSFDQPAKVRPAMFTGVQKQGDDLVVEMPAMSIVVLELK